MRQFSVKNQQRSCSLEYSLHISNQVFTVTNISAIRCISCPSLNMLMESTYSFEASSFFISSTQSQNALKFRPVFDFRYKTALAQPFLKSQTILILTSPLILFHLFDFSPPPRIDVKMRYRLCFPLRMQFGRTQQRSSIKQSKKWFLQCFSCSNFIHFFKGLINISIGPIFPNLWPIDRLSIHKPIIVQVGISFEVIPRIHIVPFNIIGFNLVPQVTYGCLDLCTVQNIIKNNYSILCKEQSCSLLIEVVDIKGNCVALAIQWQFSRPVGCFFFHTYYYNILVRQISIFIKQLTTTLFLSNLSQMHYYFYFCIFDRNVMSTLFPIQILAQTLKDLPSYWYIQSFFQLVGLLRVPFLEQLQNQQILLGLLNLVLLTVQQHNKICSIPPKISSHHNVISIIYQKRELNQSSKKGLAPSDMSSQNAVTPIPQSVRSNFEQLEDKVRSFKLQVIYSWGTSSIGMQRSRSSQSKKFTSSLIPNYPDLELQSPNIQDSIRIQTYYFLFWIQAAILLVMIIE